MKRDRIHANRRILCLGLPTIAAGAALYVPNALPLNGPGTAGIVLMIGAAIAATIEASNTTD